MMTLETLIAREEIRELAQLYSRGVDRKDGALLRTLYTADATDTHGDSFDGGAEDYVAFLERSFPHMRYSGHHICNHLITVDGNTGEGEVYAYAFHIIPDGAGGWLEDIRFVRYLDHYRKTAGKWCFSKRVVTYDYSSQHPAQIPAGDTVTVPLDPATFPQETSYGVLSSPFFARGPRR